MAPMSLMLVLASIRVAGVNVRTVALHFAASLKDPANLLS